MHDRVGIKGTVVAELIDESGQTTIHTFRNSVRDALREAIASSIAQESASYPDKIAVGNGSAEIRGYRGAADQDSQISLGDTGQVQLAQMYYANYASYPGGDLGRGVYLYLKRVGALGGTLTVELQTNSSGLPNGTPITGGTSAGVSTSVLGTSYSWIPFWFSAQTPPSFGSSILHYYHIVLKSSGYTYSLGVNEIIWGTDTSSPGTTTSRELMSKYNGSAWSTVSPSTGACFRIINMATAFQTGVSGVDGTASGGTTGTLTKTITGRSKQNKIAARLMATFAKSEFNDYIHQVGLLDANGVLCAIANTLFYKTNTQVLNIYWVLEVE